VPTSSHRLRLCVAAGLCALIAGAAAVEQALATPTSAGESDGRAAVTFAGFHVFENGTSRLYVKLTRAVPVQPTLAGKRAEYLLVGAMIPIRNNKNPLITRHFVAEVVTAQLVPEGEGKGRAKGRASGSRSGDARLIVEMREAVTPEHRVVRNADGTAMLVVDFPKLKRPPAPEPEETGPTTKTTD
jgi:hypothetical protein